MSFSQLTDFLTKYDVAFLTTSFCLVWVFALFNWCKNPYRNQNRKLNLCRRKILVAPIKAGIAMSSVPAEYSRQWRAYVSSGAAKPSTVFEFVPRKNRIVLWRTFVLCAIVSVAYLALYACDTSNSIYLFFQIAFWVSFALALVINKIIFSKHEKTARRIFGKFVAQLNASQPQKAIPSQQPDTIAKQLHEIKKGPVSDASLEHAAKLLHENGLDGNRTVEEQRKINVALNGLLQAYANNTMHT